MYVWHVIATFTVLQGSLHADPHSTYRFPVETGYGIIDGSFIASNAVDGTGAGLQVTDCTSTKVTNTIFFNNGAALGKLLRPTGISLC